MLDMAGNNQKIRPNNFLEFPLDSMLDMAGNNQKIRPNNCLKIASGFGMLDMATTIKRFVRKTVIWQ